MAGIYVHIPFCKQACSYCNFYFSTSRKTIPLFVSSLLKEICLQANFFSEKPVIQSIYFGGGTPSLLDTVQLESILNALYTQFTVAPYAECTIECNPDDLDIGKLSSLKQIGFNRLSIGIQSFNDADLQYMHRAHSAYEAHKSVIHAQKAGFENISIDLIYGTPTMSDQTWEKNIHTFLDWNLPHLSCYALTVEPHTTLQKKIHRKKSAAVCDEQTTRQFTMLIDILEKNGYTPYEISNFAQANNYAIHNTAYWQQKPYLGLGPSAHSFNGKSRRWNISNTKKYIDAIESNNLPYTQESLSENDRYNEYIMTSIRTIWGVSKLKLLTDFGVEKLLYFEKNISPFIQKKQIQYADGVYVLTHKGKLICDYISAHLFYV